MATPVPTRLPEDFNAVFGMGAPRAFFEVKKLTRWGEAIAALVLLGGAALALVWGVYSAFTGMQQYGQVVFWERLTPALIISVISGGLGLLAVWSAVVNWRKAVAFYENGLAYRDRTGIHSWRWDQAAQVFSAVTRHYTNGIYTGTTHLYTLNLADGARLKFDNKFDKIEALGHLLQELSFKPLYQKAADAYNAGQVVTFGPVAISKQGGLALGKKTYPWNEIAQVSVQKGYLQVSKKGGGWFSGANTLVSVIPNLNVALAIIDQIVGVA
ncbi:MAG: DUF6585 family protein [Chloroflexota bacterium]